MTNDKTNVSEVVRFEAERFSRLIEAVEVTPDSEFDIWTWFGPNACGTVGCAVGNYVNRNPGCGLFLVRRPSTGDLLPSIRRRWQPDQDSWYEIAEHFGINGEEARELFLGFRYPVCDPSRDNVLARLRAFLASKLPDCRPDPHAMRAKYAAMSDADLASRTDAVVDAGKLDGVLAQRSTRDEGRAMDHLCRSMSRRTTPAVVAYPTPKLPPTPADYQQGHAESEAAHV